MREEGVAQKGRRKRGRGGGEKQTKRVLFLDPIVTFGAGRCIVREGDARRKNIKMRMDCDGPGEGRRYGAVRKDDVKRQLRKYGFSEIVGGGGCGGGEFCGSAG